MNDSRKLRYGILGAARINERLMPAIVQAANAELVAIASRRPGAAAETLAKYAPGQEGVRIHDSPDALLDDPEVEAVYLPLANREHAEWTLKAVQKGKHVLCEKPMALRVKEIEAIEAAAARAGVKVMEGFMYRFHPQHAQVMDILQSGAIGEVRLVRASYSFMMRPARMYRISDSVEHGGGAMWDIGCYAIHSARMFFDRDPLTAVAVGKFNDKGADTTTSGILDFGDGRRAHFDFSFECSRRSEYEVWGTQGGLRCHTVWQLPGDLPVISWWTEDGRRAQVQLAPANHFVLEVEHFSDCVLNDRPPRLSLADAKSNCRTIVAALRSMASGRVEKV
jgi:predicted dehydrogenase